MRLLKMMLLNMNKDKKKIKIIIIKMIWGYRE